MTSALITGATGQDGSYLVEQLERAGWDVHALVRSFSDAEEQVLPEWVTPHVGDLADAASLARIVETVQPDAIFNLGGISSVEQSWRQPELTAHVSGLAVATLLESAWALQERSGKQVRFVQASSSEIFGNATDLPQTESTAIDPVSPYGAAKAFAHQLVRVYRGRGLFASNAIFYNHESPRRPVAFVTRKITVEVARIARGLSDKLVLGNLDAERDWGWAPDYVDALMRIGATELPDDFVIATGVSHTVREFVETALAAAGIDNWHAYLDVDERFVRPVDAPTMCGDSSHARRTLGWAPSVDFPDIVTAMVTHDLDQLDG
ncbi:MAG: GDP-mannose 4,6-dehydratase [Lacisediminihabitans sp.]